MVCGSLGGGWIGQNTVVAKLRKRQKKEAKWLKEKSDTRENLMKKQHRKEVGDPIISSGPRSVRAEKPCTSIIQ